MLLLDRDSIYMFDEGLIGKSRAQLQFYGRKMGILAYNALIRLVHNEDGTINIPKTFEICILNVPFVQVGQKVYTVNSDMKLEISYAPNIHSQVTTYKGENLSKAKLSRAVEQCVHGDSLQSILSLMEQDNTKGGNNPVYSERNMVGANSIFVDVCDSIDPFWVSTRVFRLNPKIDINKIKAKLADTDFMTFIKERFKARALKNRSLGYIMSTVGSDEHLDITITDALNMSEGTYTLYLKIADATLQRYKAIQKEKGERHKERTTQIDELIQEVYNTAAKLGYYKDGELNIYTGYPYVIDKKKALDTCMDNLFVYDEGNVYRFEEGKLVIEDFREYSKRENMNPIIRYRVYGEERECTLDNYVTTKSRKIIDVRFKNNRYDHGINSNIYRLWTSLCKFKSGMAEEEILAILKEQKIIDAQEEQEKLKNKTNKTKRKVKTPLQREKEKEADRRREGSYTQV